MPPLIEIREATHLFPNGLRVNLPDLRVERGEARALVGPSGSGKSTLLLVIAGLLLPSTGHVLVAGEPWEAVARPERDRRRGQLIGFVPQAPHLVATLTVADNLRLAQYLAGMRQDRTRVAEALDALDLTELAHRYPHQLSRGQQQRAAIARATVNRPRLLLADEPTASLDDESCERALDLLFQSSRAADATLIIATHDARARKRFDAITSLHTEIAA